MKITKRVAEKLYELPEEHGYLNESVLCFIVYLKTKYLLSFQNIKFYIQQNLKIHKGQFLSLNFMHIFIDFRGHLALSVYT